MKRSSLIVFLTALIGNPTLAAAQEFRSSASLLTRETWTESISGSVSYAYDNDLDLTSLRVNARTTIAFSHDADKLLIRAGDLTIARNPQNGLISGTTLGSVTDSWSYNDFGEPANYSAAFGASPLYTAQFSRDVLGRITGKTETIGGVTSDYTYTYDPAGRLTMVTLNGLTHAAYAYDSNDNRLSVVSDGTTRNGSYDAQDRLLSLGSTTYTWTANGDLETKTANGQTTRYEYDVFGNLLQSVLSNGTTIEYLIDGRNRRVGKKVNGLLAQGFLFEGTLRPIAELDGAGHVLSEFVYGLRENVPEYMIKGGQTYRILCDLLGSPRLLVNVATGQIAQRMDYDAFGRVTADTAPGFQPFGFAGGLYDRDTALVRFGARDYDADTGRWTAKDPILFAAGEPNFYGYAGNDPVNFTDVSGLQDCSSGPSPQLPIVRKINEFRKKLEKSPIQPGGQPDFAQDFTDKQAKEKGMQPPPGPGGVNFGLSLTFSF